MKGLAQQAQGRLACATRRDDHHLVYVLALASPSALIGRVCGMM